MDRFIAAALVALALPGSVQAEPNETIEEGPPALELSELLVRALLFAPASGPQREVLGPVSDLAVVARPAEVLDWVSPVFVWVEPGYAYAETSIAFE